MHYKADAFGAVITIAPTNPHPTPIGPHPDGKLSPVI